MTISSANLVAPDQKLVLTDLKENLPIPATSTKLPGHGKLLTAEHSTASDGAPHGTSRHSAAAEVLQLRAELHRERLASAAAKADSLRLIENMCAQRDEARERALGLQAALDAHLRAEAARLADDARSARSTPTPPAAAARIVAAPHLHTAPGTAGGPPASQDEAALLAAVAQPLGFHRGRPVAAALIFRCCMHWGTLEHDPAALGERIIAAVTRHADSGNMPPAGDAAAHRSYWLANTATLLLLLQQHTQATAVPPPQHLSLLSSARSKLSMLARYRPSGTDVSALSGGGFQAHHGGTRRPAHILKQAMADCVDSLMTDLRDGAKHALQAPLSLCIQASSIRLASKQSAAATEAGAWDTLIQILQGLHEQLAANEVPLFLRRKLFLQLLSFINVQLFNQLLLRRECCSFANGEYVKQGLAQVEEWLLGMGAEVAGESWDELKYIRQAVNFLVLHAKQKKTLDDIQQNLCSALSVQQLYRISTMYWDDKFGTETVSPEVLQQMRGVMQRQQGSASHSFLLDDDSSNPFQAAEVQLSMNDKVLYSAMPVPEPLQGNKAFDFLQRDLQLSALAVQPPQQ